MTGTATATATSTQAKVRQQPGSAAGIGERSGATADGTISPPNVTVTLDDLNISDITVPDPGLAVTTSNVGGNQAHENRTPILTVNACVALVGIFPSRN
jgi:microcystin-dependent protein